MPQPPSIGRSVHLKLNDNDCEAINRRREDAMRRIEDFKVQRSGVQIHFGNLVKVGDVVSMTITKVHPDGLINGQCILDGNDSYFATGRMQGTENGQWDFPAFVPAKPDPGPLT